jgi:2-desacetyl-2-hydroxyethyl bacteriochlorophyllide A dehydrogenase
VNAHRVVFPEANRVDFEVEELPKPGSGQALLRTLFSLISTGTELTLLGGGHPQGSFWENYGCYPVHPGYGQVAEVVAVGPGVECLRPGDRVLSTGGHRSASVADVARLAPLPPDVFPEEAVFHTIGAGVINAVRLGQLALGESVAVVGLGLLGQFAVRLAHVAGARPVIAVDLAPERLDIAQVGGATATLNPLAVDVRAEVARLTRGRMADVVFEMTGSPDAIPTAMRLARGQGRYVQVGCPRGTTVLDFTDAVLLPGLRIVGALFSLQLRGETPEQPWSLRRNTELFLDLVRDGSLEIASLITHRYAWQDAAAAYAMLRNERPRALGVLIDWSD